MHTVPRWLFGALLTTVLGLGVLLPAGIAADEASTLPVNESAKAVRAERITSGRLDAVVERESKLELPTAIVADDQLLRRATFDLIGRPPTVEEQQQFAADTSPDKQVALVERLLAHPQFGVNWANYWSDVIAYRVPPPELTYLNYTPLKTWLAGQLNQNQSWGSVVRALVTGKGKVDEEPTATFVGYHGAKATNLAAETSRIFLGQQIACAECHDHPFADWKREQFHAMAAFFARSKSKLPWNDGGATVVSAADKGEYLMADMKDPEAKGTEMQPTFLDGRAIGEGESDAKRRARLARWLTARTNPWFAKAYTNRVWARLMGQGFFEPVDDLGSWQEERWSAVHDALAGHFAATDYDVKDLFRVIMTSRAYAAGARIGGESSEEGPPAPPLRLRADEIFAALSVGLELPNHKPPAIAPTKEIRFPPPPQSTQDLVNGAFGVDPSLRPTDAPRTIVQALWMMNNDQLLKQVNASPGSGTMLAKLLDTEPDDARVCEQLFQRVLARAASEDEVRIAKEQVAKLGDRRAAFEDLLWALVNSAEFTSRR